jgi:16S rRNA processing protein RimM
MTPTPELNPETAVTVGRISAAHGVRGEVKVQPLTDFPERFQRGSLLWMDGAPQKVVLGRPQGRNIILKLEGVNTRTDAEALIGKELMATEATLIEEEDVYYLHDVIGLLVEDEKGETLGQLAEVLSTGSNDVFVVRGERGELLLPAMDDVVREVDIAGGRVVVEVPDGIEFAKAPQPRPRGRRPPQRKERNRETTS